mmetsp:Transcript_3383/g.11896  ORF Transcript_3383/g.11896 Transcript_3383/m.11896 type:complete len:205 (+) Transcript_3383:250-864(+)
MCRKNSPNSAWKLSIKCSSCSFSLGRPAESASLKFMAPAEWRSATSRPFSSSRRVCLERMRASILRQKRSTGSSTILTILWRSPSITRRPLPSGSTIVMCALNVISSSGIVYTSRLYFPNRRPLNRMYAYVSLLPVFVRVIRRSPALRALCRSFQILAIRREWRSIQPRARVTRATSASSVAYSMRATMLPKPGSICIAGNPPS